MKRCAIREIETENVVHIYEAEELRDIDSFPHPWNTGRYESIEHPETVEELRGEKIVRVKAEGLRRVHDALPPHTQRRLALRPDGDPERVAASALIEAVKQVVDKAEADLATITTPEELAAFQPVWPA